MTVGETIKQLENAENYISARLLISDQFIEMVKAMMPSAWERIEEKENEYQEIISCLKDDILKGGKNG